METQIKDPRATEHTRSRYNLIAPHSDFMERPIERGRNHSWRADLWNTVRREAGDDEVRVLELGVGTGKNIPFYPAQANVTAVDLSEAMLARAQEVARQHPDRQVELQQMDIQELDFANDAFDLTVATFVFCSVPDPVLGLREALRVTRPGGRLLLLEHMIATTPGLARLMTWLDSLVHWMIGVHIARHTVSNVERAGWQLDRVKPLSKFDIFRRIEAHKPA